MLRIFPMSVTGILCDVIGEFTIAIGGLAIGEWLIMIDELVALVAAHIPGIILIGQNL